MFRTALIGFGKIAAGYDNDERMTKYFDYVTHAAILFDHPEFCLTCVVDPDERAQNAARNDWGVEYVYADVNEISEELDIEVVILATPPAQRLSQVRQFNGLKAILTEKPMGISCDDSQSLVQWCEDHDVLLQVNFWRRAEERLQKLAAGELRERIGHIQFAQGIYGNGLLNNGCHLIDMARFLLGEIEFVQAHMDFRLDPLSPIKGDVALSFTLYGKNGCRMTFQAIDFRYYREIGLQIWGTLGRVDLLQETLSLSYFGKKDNRGLRNAYEIASDCPVDIGPLGKYGFYNMYSNLADALKGRAVLCSSGNSALKNEQIIEAIFTSHKNTGLPVQLDYT